MAASKHSAGLLMFRRTGDDDSAERAIEVFLAHPGGPYFGTKDEGAWTIPKGLIDPDEHELDAAKREFEEETGLKVAAERFIDLGEVTQKGGKRVRAFAFEYAGDGSVEIESNTFEIEWPPKSGAVQRFPEIDEARFFDVEGAKRKINPAQAALIDRLVDALYEEDASGTSEPRP